jgi:small subunit ribosomal protein S18
MAKGRGDFEGGYGSTNVPVVRNVFFRRSRGCPLAEVPDSEIDYKNVELLSRFISERGRIMPSRISSVSAKKQRKLAKAIKRSRMLALMPFVSQ